MVVLHAALHVLQFVEHGKHVDEFAQREQVGLWHKVLSPLSVTKALHLAAEALYGFPLQRYCKEWRNGPFSCKTFLTALRKNLPGSTWISWAWSLQVLKPPLSSRKSPLCWVAHCILPVNHKREAVEHTVEMCLKQPFHHYVRCYFLIGLLFTTMVSSAEI